MEDQTMNLDVIKKASKATLLGLASVSVFSCAGTANSSSESSALESEQIDSSISSEPQGAQILATLKGMKAAQNYTASANDDLGSMVQYFMPNFYCYKFEGVYSTTMFGYCEDDIGIYQINVNFNTGKVIKQGYYEVDTYGEKLKNLYDNVAYSLKDLSFKASDYEEKEDKLYLTNLRSNDALVLYSVFGYTESDSTSGIYFANVSEICFAVTDNNSIEMSLTFDSDSASASMGTSTMVFSAIGSTVRPSCYDEFYNAGNKGKIRVEQDDPLFDCLGKLKTMTNYTVKIESHYQITQYGNRNYTTTLMFDNDCYYSTSDRDTDGTIGFIVSDEVVKSCLVDDVSNKLIIGDTYQDEGGNTKTSIFDVVYSFHDLVWDEYTIGTVDVAENKWNIDDSKIIEKMAYISNDTFLRYQWQSIDFTYDADKNEYHFLCNLVNDESLNIDVVDVGSTVIYQK